ncbi:helix-turn-helix domain-containing protein, partial [Streptomyces diastaticus]|uniref:helix-turn-helix domain-containing protein n=1 Tax=Streptomyces diastaticus TaxID=1956 RepID=UPI00366689C7
AGQGEGPAAPAATARTAPPAATSPPPGPPGVTVEPRSGAAPAAAASPTRFPDAPAEVFAPVGAGGLGRTAERNWHHLRAAGAGATGLDEVSAAAGYQPATVTRHLEGLAERGLARLDGGRWYAVAPGGSGGAVRGAAAAEASAPAPAPASA